MITHLMKMAKIKSSNYLKWWKFRERGSLIQYGCGFKMEQSLWNSLTVSYKLNMKLPYDPAIALLGFYPRNMKDFFAPKHSQKQIFITTCFIYLFTYSYKTATNPYIVYIPWNTTHQ